METDEEPKGAKRVREFQKSDGLGKISVPSSETLKPHFEAIVSATEIESVEELKNSCNQLLVILSHFYGVNQPSLELLGVRPHRTLEGHLAAFLFGDYHTRLARIRIWTRTAMRKQWSSPKTTLSTLCHEFMHHLDLVHLGFPSSYHTTGFYQRVHRLYLAAIDHPIYELDFRPTFMLDPGAPWIIDWPGTNKNKAKAVARFGKKRRPGQHRLVLTRPAWRAAA